MGQLILPLLMVAVLVALASITLKFVSWVMKNGLANRLRSWRPSRKTR